VGQDILTADLVVQGIEAIAGFCLRFRVQRWTARGASFVVRGPGTSIAARL
jgi:hypothetical protein